MPSTLQQVVADPEFGNLSDDDKAHVITRIDPSFAELSAGDKATVLQRLGGGPPQAVDHKARLAALQAAQGVGDTGVQSAFVNDTPLGQIGSGLAKGVASTTLNLGALAHRTIPGMDVIAPDRAGAFAPDSELRRNLETHSPLEGAAKTTEQIAEYFLPGAAQAGALAPLARLASSPLPQLARDVIMQGATAAGVSGAQGGDPLASGGTAAAVTGILGGAGRLAPWAVNSMLGVKPANMAGGTNPGLGVLKEGVYGPTATRFIKALTEAKTSVAARLDSYLARFNHIQLDPTAAIADPLDRAITVSQNLPGPLQSLSGIKTQLLGMVTGPMTPQQVNRLRDFADEIKFAAKGNPDSAEIVSQAMNGVTRNLNATIDAVSPAARNLRHTFGNLAEATKAFVNKTNAAQGHIVTALSLTPAMYPLAHGDVEKAAKYAATGLLLKQGGSSPATVIPAAQLLRIASSPNGLKVLSALGAKAAAGDANSKAGQHQ